jgi:hypothetical protein
MAKNKSYHLDKNNNNNKKNKVIKWVLNMKVIIIIKSSTEMLDNA